MHRYRPTAQSHDEWALPQGVMDVLHQHLTSTSELYASPPDQCIPLGTVRRDHMPLHPWWAVDPSTLIWLWLTPQAGYLPNTRGLRVHSGSQWAGKG